ncbi:MAG TPA: Rieske 2Fe-2S domain-containing protein [Candidatus Acidoferrales bacterium]|nr:Rieske 2Fe-2S domain-containing protein [Candidatus Acidoferrales bacterium]
MLTRQDNELVTRVGPGTPLGEVMRRYWIPALLSEDIPAPDCPPVRVKLLGEELVAFRDTQGRIGLLEEYCPHRLASMFLGRNEHNGLTCVYHGWKFDVNGTCVDMPNEPIESRFKEKVRMRSYPTIEQGGVIWTYMGPPDKKPEGPGMEWTRAPQTHRFVSKTIEYCNYLQAIEGGIDTVHSSFLHNNDLSNMRHFKRIDTAPRLEVEKTAYGFRYAGIRDVGEIGNYVRIYQFVMPFHQFRSHQVDYDAGTGARLSIPLIKGHMWVPMDDENTMIYNWMLAADENKPLTPEFIERMERIAGRGPGGEGTIRHQTRANDWLIDREVQRTKTYTGIKGLNTQDLAVQESMGPIVDRSREHLGSTDKAIIMCRRVLLDAIRDVQNGKDPAGADPGTYRKIRPADIMLPKEARWQEAAQQHLIAQW